MGRSGWYQMLRTDEMNDDIGNNNQTEQTSGHTKRVETTGDKRGRKKNQRKDTVSESEKMRIEISVQGWARRLRDLDVRGGAVEGTAPRPCAGTYCGSISPHLRCNKRLWTNACSYLFPQPKISDRSIKQKRSKLTEHC